MRIIWKSCCYLFLINICCILASANICTNITLKNFNLKPLLLKNVQPGHLLLSSPEFYLINDAKDIRTCCQICCDDMDCQSVFFNGKDCFLTRCSFIGDVPRLCSYGYKTAKEDESHLTSWTWVGVKEIRNDNIDLILKNFQSMKSKNLKSEGTTSVMHIQKNESITLINRKLDRRNDDPSGPNDSTFLPPGPHITAMAVTGNDHVSQTKPPHPSMSTTTRNAWMVSAGTSRISRRPNNNFTLEATITPEPPEVEKGLYSYQWVMVSSPPSVESGHMDNMSSPSLKLSMLHEGNYTLKVIVTRGSQSNEAYVNVTVLPAMKKNKPPIAKIMPSEHKLNQQNDLVLDGSESSDDDGITSYKWELVSGPATGAFPKETTFNQSVFKLKGPLTPGLYKFRLTVVDSYGASDETDATVDVIKEVDYPPKANAGNNQIIYLPTNYVTLMGNASYDDRGIVSYEWTKDSNNLVNDMTGARTPFLQLSNLQVGDYTFTLTVTDASNQVDKAEVHVIVKPAQNQPPVSDAGLNQTLFLPLAEVELNASNSTDDNKIVSYLWRVLDGPDKPRVENANQSKARMLNPSVGIYILEVKVADGMGLEATSKVWITIKQNPNAPPVANAGGNMEVELNQGHVIIINGSLSYDDRGISKYLWMRDNKSPAAGVPLMNSDHTPVLQLVNMVKGQYIWTLEVTDTEGLTNRSQMVLNVKRDPKEDSLVRLVLGVGAEMFTGLYKDALQSHLEDLVKKNFGASGSRVTLNRLSQDPITGRTVIDFYAESNFEGGWMMHLGDEIQNILKYELTTGFSNTLEFPIIDIFSVVCHRNCSGHGKCDQTTRSCICDPFWTSNWFKANYGSRETNCDWSILYVTIVVIILVVIVALIVWYVVYTINKKIKRKCRPTRSQISAKKRHRYTRLVETSNGIKTNGDAAQRQHALFDKGIYPLKVIDDLSDSSSSSEDMIFSRTSNDRQLRTMHRGRPSDGNKFLLQGVAGKQDVEHDWTKSPQVEVIRRFS